MKHRIDRRRFLKLGLLLPALPLPAFAADLSAGERRLGLHNLHTGEKLDLLHRVQTAVGSARPFEVISGYRSPASNRMLTEHSAGVAKRSLHMDGKAIDVRLPGVPLAELRRAGLLLKGGGVGYYPESNFVHLDVGRVRTWGA